jgi:hypothetical protein
MRNTNGLGHFLFLVIRIEFHTPVSGLVLTRGVPSVASFLIGCCCLSITINLICRCLSFQKQACGTQLQSNCRSIPAAAIIEAVQTNDTTALCCKGMSLFKVDDSQKCVPKK